MSIPLSKDCDLSLTLPTPGRIGEAAEERHHVCELSVLVTLVKMVFSVHRKKIYTFNDVLKFYYLIILSYEVK